MRVLFDHGPDGGPARFDAPLRLIEAWTPEEVPAALAALADAKGWLAGYCSHELGYLFEPRLRPLLPDNRTMPFLRFGEYAGPMRAEMPTAKGAVEALTPDWTEAEHARAIACVRDYIAAGDIYQANLTFPVRATVSGTPEGLYGALAERQPVRFGAMIEQDGPAILSRSPELFFRTAGGTIETAPMKGTQPRGTTPAQDEANRQFLSSDEKNRAENLMIVDLLRNDLSRVSVAGSVRVPDLFKVETYATVHQMVSRITAQLLPDVTLPDILRALFPCGSITGAPKVRSMQIIRELEPHPRDIYCGTIGWWAPDGRSEFNVAIRTLVQSGDAATLNVGGGIVWDSDAASEYEEALWKLRYARF